MGIMFEDAFMYDTTEGKAFVLANRHVEDESKPRYVCMAMRTNVYIGPKGEVLPCQSFIAKDICSSYPSLFDTPLREILSESTYTRDTLSKLSDFLGANDECRECEYATMCCGGCRAVAIEDHDMNYQATNKTMCTFFKNGWYQKFRDAADHYNQLYAKRPEQDETSGQDLQDRLLHTLC